MQESTSLSEEERELHASIERKIDFSKPLVPQVGHLTNREFMAFIQKPRQIDHEDAIQLHADK